MPEPGTFPPGPPKTITRQIRKLAPRGPAAKCQAASSWAGSRTVGIPPPRVVGHKVVTKRVSCEGGVTAQGIKKRGTRDPTFKRPNSLFLFLTRVLGTLRGCQHQQKKEVPGIANQPLLRVFFSTCFSCYLGCKSSSLSIIKNVPLAKKKIKQGRFFTGKKITRQSQPKTHKKG